MNAMDTQAIPKCDGCGGASTSHTFYTNGKKSDYCCRCNVFLFGCPSDWHSGCMEAYRELRASRESEKGGPS